MHRRVQAVLLIFIAFIVVLLGVGAVVKARQLSNQMTCSSQLKNLVQACHKYHDDHGCLPPGYIGPWPDRAGIDRAAHVGVLVYILPYLTKEDISWEVPYYQANLDAATDPVEQAKSYQPASDAPWWTLSNPATGKANRELARKQFSFLKCPSVEDLPPEEGIIVALHAFGKTEYKNGFLQRQAINVAEDPSVSEWGVTHYLGIMGRFGRGDEFEGIFANRSRLTLGRITVCDGTSNTFAFGEAMGELAAGNSVIKTRRLTAYSWFCGSLPSYYGLPELPQAPWNAFNGPHAGYVNFAFIDGHVDQFKRSGIDTGMGVDDGRQVPWKIEGDASVVGSWRWVWLQAMAGYKDGLAIGPSMITTD